MCGWNHFFLPSNRQLFLLIAVNGLLGKASPTTCFEALTCPQLLLPPKIRQDIVERTDGIPLFVEEMTKAVLEAENEGVAQRAAVAVPSSALAVPASLLGSLLARLDRVGPAKEVAQIGAALGRKFSHALLAAVVRKREAELATALDRLIAAGLLFRQGVAPQATYLFKHALVQDAAYGTRLRTKRKTLHASIAEAYDQQFHDIVDTKPELMAHHLALTASISTCSRPRFTPCSARTEPASRPS
jgi:predicted ATPase